MYPRAAAYIISVKQSTYCQFGEVIKARSRTGGRGGRGRERTRRRRRSGRAEKITGRRRGIRQQGEKNERLVFTFRMLKRREKLLFFSPPFCTPTLTSQDLCLQQWNTTLIGSKNGGERERKKQQKKKHVYTESISNYLQRPEMKRRGARRAAALWADSGERRLPRRSLARPPLRPVISLEAGPQPRRPPAPLRPAPPGRCHLSPVLPSTAAAPQTQPLQLKWLFLFSGGHIFLFFLPFPVSARRRKKNYAGAFFFTCKCQGSDWRGVEGEELFCFSTRLF